MTSPNTDKTHEEFFSTKMKIFNAVCIWTCLLGFEISPTDGTIKNVNGRVGGKVKITCSHEWASNNRKYFCRDPCKDRNILVSSDRPYNGRFSLKDEGKGTVTVTIIDLLMSNSGVYWCGVDRVGVDTFHEVNLSVYKADTHTTRRTTPPMTTSDSQTPMRTSFTPSPDDIINSTLFTDPGTTFDSPGRVFLGKAGVLLCIAVGLIVMLVILGWILCMFRKKKRKSHSSSGLTPADAERCTTCTTEPTGRYEGIAETQQYNVVYATINHHSATNRIQDSSLYSNLSIQPSDSINQTAESNTDTVMYASINVPKKQGPPTFRSEDSVTYATVFCS